MHHNPDLPLAELAQGQVWGLARRLMDELAGQRVLLLSEQRDLVAAACLAAFAGDLELILPHGLSQAALGQLPEEMAIDRSLESLPGDAHHIPAEATPPQISDPERLAVTLFTGGSTARPRAWPKSAALLFGEPRYLAEFHGVSPKDHIVSCVGPLHIYGLFWSALVPLVSGARVAPDTAFLPAEVQAACPPGNLLVAAPPHYRALVKSRTRVSGLRLAISSAGMLPEEDSVGFTELSDAPVCEMYGSTETGALATRWRRRGERDWTPLPMARLALAEDRLSADSPFIGPDLPRDGKGLFVTGDRARWTGGGRFELLGRADGVVKVGGNRVDLLEMEAYLQDLAQVDEAWVMTVPSLDGHENQIVAVLSGAGLPERETIRQHLEERFDAVALPRRMVYLEHMPITPAGKRDRRAVEELLRAAREEKGG